MATIASALGLGEQHYGDIQVPIVDLAVGTVPPTVGAIDNFRFYAYTINDDGNFEFTIPRDWKPLSNIDLQIYWACNETFAANTGEVRWQIITEPIAVNSTEVVGAGTATTVSGTDTNIPTLARQLTTTTLSMDGTLVAVQELVRCRLIRIALTGGANPVQEPEVYRIVVHYTKLFPTHYQD